MVVSKVVVKENPLADAGGDKPAQVKLKTVNEVGLEESKYSASADTHISIVRSSCITSKLISRHNINGL